MSARMHSAARAGNQQDFSGNGSGAQATARGGESTMKHRAAVALIVVLLWAGGAGAQAANKTKGQRTLAEYLSSLKEPPATAAAGRTLGSLWSDNSGLGQLAADYKAGRLNDSIIVRIAEQTTANQTGTVAAQRSLSASSGITALPGALKTTGVAQLFSPNSSYQLKGQGTASSASTIQSTLSGTVVAVLASGSLVVERGTRSWPTTSTRTLPCGEWCGRGTLLPTTVFFPRK